MPRARVSVATITAERDEARAAADRWRAVAEAAIEQAKIAQRAAEVANAKAERSAAALAHWEHVALCIVDRASDGYVN